MKTYPFLQNNILAPVLFLAFSGACAAADVSDSDSFHREWTNALDSQIHVTTDFVLNLPEPLGVRTPKTVYAERPGTILELSTQSSYWYAAYVNDAVTTVSNLSLKNSARGTMMFYGYSAMVFDGITVLDARDEIAWAAGQITVQNGMRIAVTEYMLFTSSVFDSRDGIVFAQGSVLTLDLSGLSEAFLNTPRRFTLFRNVQDADLVELNVVGALTAWRLDKVPNGDAAELVLTVIPEPSAAALCALGAFSLVWRRRRGGLSRTEG